MNIAYGRESGFDVAQEKNIWKDMREAWVQPWDIIG